MASESSTFLFTDLVGYTALAAAEGDDRAADVALAFFASVRGLLAEHGAEEVKTLGDGMMLRAERADAGIRLGVRIVETLESDPDSPPVRVGVHTGPAVNRDGDWFGTTVNVASRLCSAAGDGEVLVSEDSREAAGQMPKIELAERRLHWLKNVTDPVAARVATARSGCADVLRRAGGPSRIALGGAA